VVRIRISPENWGRVWRELVASGPVSRVSAEREYILSQDQVRLLRTRKLPFEVIPTSNGRPSTDERHA